MASAIGHHPHRIIEHLRVGFTNGRVDVFITLINPSSITIGFCAVPPSPAMLSEPSSLAPNTTVPPTARATAAQTRKMRRMSSTRSFFSKQPAKLQLRDLSRSLSSFAESASRSAGMGRAHLLQYQSPYVLRHEMSSSSGWSSSLDQVDSHVFQASSGAQSANGVDR